MCSGDTLLAKYMMWVIPSWNQGNLMHSGKDHYPTIILEVAAKGVFVEKKIIKLPSLHDSDSFHILENCNVTRLLKHQR